MNRWKTALFVLGIVLYSGAARADEILLLLTKGPSMPGGATLSWTGDVPNLEVVRGPALVTLVITGGRQTIDPEIPAPGALFFYRVSTLGPCSPLDPAAICGLGARCYPTEDHLTDCSAPVGPGTQCGACSSDAHCAATFFCPSGGPRCAQWCRIGVAGDCPPPYSCFNFIPVLFAGSQAYGVCACI